MDPNKYLRARVTGRRDVSEDLWTLRLALDAPFPFKPGQYATLAFEDAGGVHERAYSIASSPLDSELEFFIELVPEGETTPTLHTLHAGDELWVRKSAKGLFTLDRKSGHHHHLFVATVTGVAPFMSMLRTWARDPSFAPPETRILLIEAASRDYEFPYVPELDALAGKLPGVKVVHAVSRSWECQGWQGECGRAEDILRKYADADGFTAGDTTAYVCGHPQMIENVKGMLKRGGFAKEAVHEEVYWIPAKAAPASA